MNLAGVAEQCSGEGRSRRGGVGRSGVGGFEERKEGFIGPAHILLSDGSERRRWTSFYFLVASLTRAELAGGAELA